MNGTRENICSVKDDSKSSRETHSPSPLESCNVEIKCHRGNGKKKNICLKRRNSFSPGSAMNKLFLNLKTRQKIQRVGLKFTLCTDVFRRINYLLIYCQ